MSGGGRSRGGGADGTADDDASRSPRDFAKDSENLEPLFVKLRAIAREEESEAARMPDDFVAPLSSADRESVVAATLASLAGNQNTSRVGAQIPIRTLPGRLGGLSRTRRWAAIVVPLAAAAALALLLLPARRGSEADLPSYGVTASGALKQRRGSVPAPTAIASTETTVQRVGQRTELTILARPTTEVAGELAARVFLVRDGSAREIVSRNEIAPSGSIELRVRPAGDAPGATGPAALRIVVGRPAFVQAVEASEAVGGGGARTTRWLTVPIELHAD